MCDFLRPFNVVDLPSAVNAQILIPAPSVVEEKKSTVVIDDDDFEEPFIKIKRPRISANKEQKPTKTKINNKQTSTTKKPVKLLPKEKNKNDEIGTDKTSIVVSVQKEKEENIQICEETSDIEVLNCKSSPLVVETSTVIVVPPVVINANNTAKVSQPSVINKIEKKPSPKITSSNNITINSSNMFDKKVKQSSLAQFIKITGEPKTPRIIETKYEPVKIPKPIKYTWAKTIKPYGGKENLVEGSTYIETNYENFNFENCGGEFEGILINPPWNTDNNDTPNSITPEQMVNII